MEGVEAGKSHSSGVGNHLKFTQLYPRHLYANTSLSPFTKNNTKQIVELQSIAIMLFLKRLYI